MPDFDDWIDRQLRNVPLPPDLLRRLTECPAVRDQASTDARLDAVLRSVAVPDDLDAQLRRIARRRRPPPGWMQFALAASVFLGLGLATAGYLGFVSQQPRPATATAALPASPRTGATAARNADVAAQPALKQTVLVTDTAGSHPPERSEEPAPAQAAAVPRPSITFQDVVAAGRSLMQAVDARRQSQAALGAGGNLDRLPSLEVFEAPAPRGIAPPRVRGYDLLFQLKHGEHPFAPPSARELATSRMPFSFRTASYDLTVGAAREGQLPPADEIRVEDFLAAQDYALPPAPANRLALHVAVSPSPFEDSGLHLMQLAVKASAKAPGPRRPTRMVAVVDTSSAMLGGARWETILRALAKIADDMRPTDRLTLIGFAERATVLAENATHGDLRAIVSGGGLPQPGGIADLPTAIRAACETARDEQVTEAQLVVVITAGRGDYDDSVVASVVDSLLQLDTDNIAWQIISLSPQNSQLTDLARRARGEVIAATSASEIRAAILDKLTGQSSLVARGASLKLTFNPQVVTSYRLLGHATTTLTAEAANSLEIDLHADQTATAMYELWIKPGETDKVATAELTWLDPQSAQPRRAAQTIHRGRIAASFSQAPGWFQHGVIAAKAAEVLRGSYFAPTSRPLDRIRDLADHVEPSTAQQADFQGLLRLLEQAQKLR